MKRLFVVSVDADATVDQRNAFTLFLKEAKVGYWHHLTYCWLVHDSGGIWKAATLRDKAMEIFPGVHCLVLNVRPKDWSSLLPSGGSEWLKKYVSSSKWAD
jgi:hypothetical protein